MKSVKLQALEALKRLDPTLIFMDWENGDGEDIGEYLRNTSVALEADIAATQAAAINAELLEALKDAYPYIDNDHLRHRIGAVIAKATGEAA